MISRFITTVRAYAGTDADYHDVGYTLFYFMW